MPRLSVLLLCVALFAVVAFSAFRPQDSDPALGLQYWQHFFASAEEYQINSPATPQIVLEYTVPRYPGQSRYAPAMTLSPRYFLLATQTAMARTLYPEGDQLPDFNDQTNEQYATRFNLIAQRATGTDLISGTLTSKYKGFYAEYYAHNHTLQINPVGLQKLFDAVYISPQTHVLGCNAQKLYDASFKAYIRTLAEMTASTVSHPNFKPFAQAYHQAAYTDTTLGFDGVEYLAEQTQALMPNEFQRFQAVVPPAEYFGQPQPVNAYYSSLVGILLRRHLDGSLPTLLACLKRVLKDYDPGAYTLYGNRLTIN